MAAPNGAELVDRPAPTTNAVLAAKIDALTDKTSTVADEVRLLRTELVRRDVYDEARAADQRRIEALETAVRQMAEQREAASVRRGDRGWQVIALVIGAVIVVLMPYLFLALRAPGG